MPQSRRSPPCDPVCVALASGALVLFVAPAALSTGRVSWPLAAPSHDARASLPAWTSLASSGFVATERRPLEPLAVELDRRIARARTDANLLAMRATVARLQGDFETARTVLQRATQSDAHVLDDPATALTEAYLLAQSGRWREAVTGAQRVFAYHEAHASSDPGARAVAGEFSLEVARWSLHAGADGLDDAVAILDVLGADAAAISGYRPLRAYLLVLAGRAPEAAAVLGGVPPAQPFVLPGSLTRADVDAALAVSRRLLASGDGAAAASDGVRAAASRVPEPWRARLVAWVSSLDATPAGRRVGR